MVSTEVNMEKVCYCVSLAALSSADVLSSFPPRPPIPYRIISTHSQNTFFFKFYYSFIVFIVLQHVFDGFNLFYNGILTLLLILIAQTSLLQSP